MTRATVIGAAGFIGSRLVAHLRRLGWDCRAPWRDDREFTRQDLGTVFHCAGLTADFARRPHDTVRAHVELLNELLAHARFDSLVYLSSTRLYDGRPGFAGASVDEDTPLALDPAQPRHLFDLSKALGESLCRQASGGRARVARLSCVYSGADDDAEGFLGTLLGRLREPRAGAVLDVDSSLDAARDYVHVDDVLDALVAIATRGTRPVYNVAGGVNVSNRELFARLGELAGCELRALREPAPPCPATVSIERMRGEFGWQPASLLDRLPAMLGEPVPC
ncbi:MAG: NAD(P)-dependent oxidoreductase [Burkholderiales bacterium]|nr:NAD(P)-dependent oxidoreductase [Burkholderiales bacterium]